LNIKEKGTIGACRGKSTNASRQGRCHRSNLPRQDKRNPESRRREMVPRAKVPNRLGRNTLSHMFVLKTGGRREQEERMTLRLVDFYTGGAKNSRLKDEGRIEGGKGP